MQGFSIKVKYVDVFQERIFPAIVTVREGRIEAIEPIDNGSFPYLIPGFIDSHVHIESSMLIPSHFSSVAIKHGTIAAVCDPHEIANVMGVEGVRYMIENSRNNSIYFFYGVPSCVPATSLEIGGGKLNAEDVNDLLKDPDIYFLGEFMNFPGVIENESEVMEKIQFAKKLRKPIDGHAPGLFGKDLEVYARAGITTDHECETIEEAKGKIAQGMKILIREGSAAKNYKALAPLIPEYPDSLMFCTDDCHPGDLLKGHINEMVKAATNEGHKLFNILKIACINPVLHYQLPLGIGRLNDWADFVLVEDLVEFSVQKVFKRGELVFPFPEIAGKFSDSAIINRFERDIITPSDLRIINQVGKSFRVIQVVDGLISTNSMWVENKSDEKYLLADVSRDILKIVVANRYGTGALGIGFVSGFGFKKGACATSIAHDNHNIIAVGIDDKSIAESMNEIIRHKGGISVVYPEGIDCLPLPVAGLMSTLDAETVSDAYQELELRMRELGCVLTSPFMTLSFLALIVIPKLKISDKGLFDFNRFDFVPLFED
jgi:adenine deaminase